MLVVNGRERVVGGISSPAMLDAVLVALELRADRVAVELNGELAPRGAWEATEVKTGDKLEVVHFVGGGLGMGGQPGGQAPDMAQGEGSG